MTWSKGQIGALISLASLLAGSTIALSCGFEDPKSAASARGVLNWAFPDALHVTSAVWRAQLEGVIARNDEVTSPVKALLGFQKATVMLAAFRDSLSAARNGDSAPAVSMVLIGPMLWTRFEPLSGTLNMTSHTAGPSSGDVIIVTDDPVVAALNEGRVTPNAARELGLMRLYGSPASVQDMMSWLDRLSPRTSARASTVGN